MPCLSVSARPERISSTGNVVSTVGSITTTAGCLNAPTRFLPCERSTPVLPPTLASTIASTVVGNWIKRTPRIKVAAAG